MDTKGTYRTVQGDVTDPQFSSSNEIAIIPHCCNDVGAMGAGVAKAISFKWGGVQLYYLKSGHRLGENSWVNVNTEINNIIVVNMVAQNGLIRFSNPKPLKYLELIKCMTAVVDDIIKTLHMKPEYAGKKPVIHCPKFGSALAGGNWEFIKELIDEIWLEEGIDVVVYEF